MERAFVTEADGYLVIRSPDNPAFWWGNFLLLAAPPEPGSAASWLATFGAEFPEAKHVALGVDSTTPEVLVPADFLDAGLLPERASVMIAARVREPDWLNHDAEVRALVSDDDWVQSVELSIRCAEDETVDRDFLDRRAAARRSVTEQGHGAWFGAFHDGRLVAQLGLFGTDVGLARFQSVETDPAARRRGLAGTLLWHAGRYGLETLGAKILVIVADPAAEAIRLYRSVGFTDAETQLSLQRSPPE